MPTAATASRFTTLAVTSSDTLTGDTEYLECAGRGICNRANGVCDCFPGYGADDGTGKGGNLEYCGYRLPYVVVDKSKFEPWERDTLRTRRVEEEAAFHQAEWHRRSGNAAHHRSWGGDEVDRHNYEREVADVRRTAQHRPSLRRSYQDADHRPAW